MQIVLLKNNPHDIQTSSMLPFQIDSIHTASEVLQTAIKKEIQQSLTKWSQEFFLNHQWHLTRHSQFGGIKCRHNRQVCQKKAVNKSTYTQQLRTAVIRLITTLQVAINTDFYQAGRYTLHLDYEKSSSHAHWLFNFISITSQFHRFNIPPWCN